MRSLDARRRCAATVVLAVAAIVAPIGAVTARGATGPRVLLIGDSTLAALDWYPGTSSALDGLDHTLRAASCRAVTARSCVGRTDASGRRVRPDNALTVLQSYGPGAFDELVLMVGYDESADAFARSVVGLPAAARELGVDHITWLTFRTGVEYQAPTGDSSYRSNNRLLRSAAASSGGFISLLDWNGYVSSHPGVVEADGVHLTRSGASAVASVIRRAVDAHWGNGGSSSSRSAGSAGDTTLSYGALGDPVVELQERLLRIGAPALEPHGATGRFYAATRQAVREFQQLVRDRYDDTMVVDGIVGPVTRAWIERLDPG